MPSLAHIYHQVHFYLLEWDKFFLPPLYWLMTLVGVVAGCHALLKKRDPRAALGWAAVCVGLPAVGWIAYLVFGVNRIQTRAQSWQEGGRWKFSRFAPSKHQLFDWEQQLSPYDRATFLDLVKVSQHVTDLPLLSGNQVKVLHNGEEAYPAMLASIAKAKQWILLSTYIFESNKTGHEFIEALSAAQERGVKVRVLVDGVGTRYSKPRIQKLLQKNNIPHTLFLPLSFSPKSLHLNLRTHRKILVVDGTVGFTGGMNIGDRHLVKLKNNPRPTQDIHFQLHGPILHQLKEAFLLDWHFATQKDREETFDCHHASVGEALCRGVIAGPNEDFEKLKWIVDGTFQAAKRHIRIMTPYFIPDRAMVAAILNAVLRGVSVEIILPKKNNLPYVQWASQALLEELIAYGVKVYYQPPPFAHSKFLLVDDFYALIGSANLDPRSLRLNFEFNVEVYDSELNDQLTDHFLKVREVSLPLTLTVLKKRPLAAKLRDAAAKVFSPYL